MLGEAFALLALFNASGTKTDGAVVLVMTLFLAVVVAAGPAWKWLKVQGTVDRLERERPEPQHVAGRGRRDR